MSASEVIDYFKLQPLEREGGFWAQIDRNAYGSSIIYLMTDEDFSGLHRLLESELWVSVAGSPLELTVIDQEVRKEVLHHDGQPFHLVPPNSWFGARPLGPWSLVVLSLAPAFSGMEMANSMVLEELSSKFPDHAEHIEAITHV